MRTSIFLLTLLGLGVVSNQSLRAELVASEDFDGGAVNLLSSDVPTIDGGGGDTFAVGATAGWPTTGGIPFSLTDNSVGNVGESTFFAGDTEGVYGQSSNFNNNFLGISDTRDDGTNFPGGIATATWTFDVSGFTDLTLSIDMGSMEGSTFTYSAATLFTFEYSIDGSAALNAFTVAPGGSFSYRPLDDGTVVTEDTALFVSGLNGVGKLLAEDGSLAGNTFVDKSLSANGRLDSFITDLNGSGSELVLTLTANIPFEAAAFDNFRIEGVAVPEPSSFALFGLMGVGFGIFRRRKV